MAVAWDIILLIIACFLPPLAAFFKVGLHNEFWISLLLTILGWIPGMLYTWYIILTRNRHYYIPQSYMHPQQAYANSQQAYANPQQHQAYANPQQQAYANPQQQQAYANPQNPQQAYVPQQPLQQQTTARF
jgi:uncharacterized membrane protein YqaE (UPF0057 family)